MQEECVEQTVADRGSLHRFSRVADLRMHKTAHAIKEVCTEGAVRVPSIHERREYPWLLRVHQWNATYGGSCFAHVIAD